MQLELDGRQRIRMSMSFHCSNKNSIICADLDSAYGEQAVALTNAILSVPMELISYLSNWCVANMLL